MTLRGDGGKNSYIWGLTSQESRLKAPSRLSGTGGELCFRIPKGEDVHIIGIRVIEHALRRAGFKVISLGIHTSQEDFINAAKETKADAVLVSSLAGHARVMPGGLKDKCIEAGLKDVRLYIGGMLAVDEPK